MSKFFVIIVIAHMSNGSVTTDIERLNFTGPTKTFVTRELCEEELFGMAQKRGWQVTSSNISDEFYILKRFSSGEMMLEAHCSQINLG